MKKRSLSATNKASLVSYQSLSLLKEHPSIFTVQSVTSRLVFMTLVWDPLQGVTELGAYFSQVSSGSHLSSSLCSIKAARNIKKNTPISSYIVPISSSKLNSALRSCRNTHGPDGTECSDTSVKALFYLLKLNKSGTLPQDYCPIRPREEMKSQGGIIKPLTSLEPKEVFPYPSLETLQTVPFERILCSAQLHFPTERKAEHLLWLA